MGVKDELKGTQNSGGNGSGENDLLQFFIGVILLGVGLFLFFKRVTVSSGFWGYGYGFRIGTFSISSGLTTVPLIIGIIWYFIKPESIVPKIVITLGILIIIASIIMSIRIHFEATSMFDYILMIGMAAAGFGLILKTLFRKK